MAFYNTYSSTTTAVGTNFDTYFPSGEQSFGARGASELTLITQRIADTGTATLQAFLQFFDPTLNAFFDLLDENDGTAIQGVLYADNVWDTSATYRILTVKQILPVGATAGIKTYGTNHKAYQAPWIPEFFRYRFRSGGTSVSNTFAATAYVHSAK